MSTNSNTSEKKRTINYERIFKAGGYVRTIGNRTMIFFNNLAGKQIARFFLEDGIMYNGFVKDTRKHNTIADHNMAVDFIMTLCNLAKTTLEETKEMTEGGVSIFARGNAEAVAGRAAGRSTNPSRQDQLPMSPADGNDIPF